MRCEFVRLEHHWKVTARITTQQAINLPSTLFFLPFIIFSGLFLSTGTCKSKEQPVVLLQKAAANLRPSGNSPRNKTPMKLSFLPTEFPPSLHGAIALDQHASAPHKS